MQELILYLSIILLLIIYARAKIIYSFKIGYYEQKLKDRDVDISIVANAGFIAILKLCWAGT